MITKILFIKTFLRPPYSQRYNTMVLFLFFFCFLGSNLRHMEVPGLEGLIRAVAVGLSHSHSNPGFEPLMHLHHSSRQCWILNPLSKARDRTRNLMVPSWIRQPLSHDGNSSYFNCKYFFRVNYMHIKRVSSNF